MNKLFFNLREHRKFIIILGIIVLILLLFLGNLNYNLQHQKTTGRVVEELEFSTGSVDIQIAESLAQGEQIGNIDMETVGLDIKEPIFNNKIMEFDTSDGKINLEFDLLNYSEWVENNNEDKIESENFDINVNESSERYKWGYNVKLNDLNFMAKIDVQWKSIISDNSEIIVIDNQTLKIGNYYLSFADLTNQGYVIRVESPVLLSEVNLSEINISTTNINIIEINETETNQTNITEINEINENIINISEFILNETQTNETIINNSIINENNLSEITNVSEANEGIDTNESSEIDNITENSNENKSVLILEVNITSPEPAETELITDESALGSIGEIEKIALPEITEALPEPPTIQEQIIESLENSGELNSESVTGNMIRIITRIITRGIKGATGFFIHGWRGLTGLVISGDQNIISIYIQKDFANSSVQVGDIINLDPILIGIMSSSGSAVDDLGNVYQCGTINASGSYVLNQSITATGSCINIAANNVVLNGNGFNLTGNGGTSDYGIMNSGALNNITLKNFGNIGNFTRGIYLDQVNNSLIYNNTMISQIAQTTYAIYLNKGDLNTIENNLINWNATGSTKTSYGIYLYCPYDWKGAGSNVISGNNITIKSFSYKSYGVFISKGDISESNIIQNNYIYVSALSYSYGIYYNSYGVFYQNISKNTIDSIGTDAKGIYMSSVASSNISLCIINTSFSLGEGIVLTGRNSDNNLFYNNLISGANTSINVDGGTNNIFVNTSYSANELVDSSSSLIRKWYYQSYVKDNNGNFLINFSVRGYDKNNDLIFETLTNEFGQTEIIEIIDYSNLLGIKNYYSNYTIYAYNSTHVGNVSRNISLEQNILDDLIVISSGEFINPDPEISECRTLGAANTAYNVVADLETNTTCLVISADNISVNGNGHTITKNKKEFWTYTDKGIINIGVLNNITIKNFKDIKNFSKAIYLQDVSYSLISNNSFDSNGFRREGLYVYPIEVVDGYSNTFQNNFFNSTNYGGIYLYNYQVGGGNLFKDNTLLCSYPIEIIENQEGNLPNIVLNTTYLLEELVTKTAAHEGGSLIRKWYYQAHTIDTSATDVANASVDIYNGTYESPYITLTTNESGWTDIAEITEYVNIGGIKTYYDNSVIAANYNLTLWDDHIYNVTNQTNNLNDTFILDIDITPPVMGSYAYSASAYTAVITWTTDDPSNSSVTYWASPAQTTGDNVMRVSNHSVTLTSLLNNTNYNFNYTSCDFAGNCNTSAGIFVTASPDAVVEITGGGLTCVPNWKCEWTPCVEGIQTEINCVDVNYCESKGFPVSAHTSQPRLCGKTSLIEPISSTTETPLGSGSSGRLFGKCTPEWN
ncbi:MAG: hypothetical protein WC915_06590, partial [archaeon]